MVWELNIGMLYTGSIESVNDNMFKVSVNDKAILMWFTEEADGQKGAFLFLTEVQASLHILNSQN